MFMLLLFKTLKTSYVQEIYLREGNQCADFMSKLEVSTDIVLSIHPTPREGLLPLLGTDELGYLFIRR